MQTINMVTLNPLDKLVDTSYVDLQNKSQYWSPGTFVAVFITPENDIPYKAVELGDSSEILRLLLVNKAFRGFGIVIEDMRVSLFETTEISVYSGKGSVLSSEFGE